MKKGSCHEFSGCGRKFPVDVVDAVRLVVVLRDHRLAEEGFRDVVAAARVLPDLKKKNRSAPF